MKTKQIKKISVGLLTFWLFAAGLLISAGVQAAGDPAQVDISSSGVSITPPNPSNFASMVVRIANPDDSISEYRSSGETIYWDSSTVSDGAYRYEVRVLLTTSSDSEEAQQLYSRTHGWFIVSGGVATPPPGETSAITPETSVLLNAVVWLLDVLIPSTQAANLVANDSFPEVRFEDTTLGASFDIFSFDAGDIGANSFFQLEINNGTSFSSNEIFNFIVPRTSAGSVDGSVTDDSFTLNVSGDIGLADGSVFIDRSVDRMGIGTIIPAAELHVVNGSTPAIRIDDGGTGVWELREANDGLQFRDVVDGFFPLILSGSDGRVGMGTGNPTKQLHVLGDDGTTGTANDTAIRVENISGTTGTRMMLNLENNGGVRFDMLDVSTGNNWVFQNQVGTFDITLAGTGTREFRFNPNGNLEIAGVLIQSSSRTVKQDIIPVNHQQILDKVLALPIAEWSYIKDAEYRHIGPMAEDFYAAFELGHTDKGLSSVDTGGIALAAIQGLKQKQDEEIEVLQIKNAALQQQLNKLQELVYQLAAKGQVSFVQ